MATARYFILERAPEFAEAVGGDNALRGFGPRTLEQVDAPKPSPSKVTTAEMSPSDAASERRREGVQVVGRAMPLKLIQPLAKSKNVTAAGEVAWGVSATGADKSHYDGSGVKVAILDTGIKADHPAFKAMNPPKMYDFTTGTDGKADDANGHGTHCAGTIFGRDVDGVRIGIAKGVEQALIGKVIPDHGSGDSGMLFDALNWASGNGANIVSMSLGFDFPGLVDQLILGGMPAPAAVSDALVAFGQNLRAFDSIMATVRAYDGRNMLVVAAAGNESKRAIPNGYRISASLPSAAFGVVSVGAYGKKGAGFDIAPFSNSDPQIAGPGVDIVSAALDNHLAEMSGTSMACPHLAGLAALWWQKIASDGNTPTPDFVRTMILANAKADGFPNSCGEVDRGRGRALAPA